MFKKIVIGVSVVACLATSGFSEEMKLDKNFCKNDYKTFKYNFFEVMNSPAQIKGTGDASEIIGDRTAGKMSTSMLKDVGFGIEVAKNWSNISYTFNKYLQNCSTDDLVELSKFYIVIFYDAENVMTATKNGQKNYVVARIENYIEQLKQNGNFGANDHLRFFLTNFTQLKSERLINSDLYNHFTKMILNYDTKGAKEFIKSTNAKYGISDIYEEIDSDCQKQK